MRRALVFLPVLIACAPEETEPVDTGAGALVDSTIRFRAQVGDAPMRCVETFSDVGMPPASVGIGDFRVYVSDFLAITPRGDEPFALIPDDTWQLEDLALLDFETGQGACIDGDAPTHRDVAARIPDDATGLVFTVGVPDALNKGPITDATPAPLSHDELLFSETVGYVAFTSVVVGGGTGRWPVRIFDVWGTSPEGASRKLQETSVTHRLAAFDASTDAVVLDLGLLLSDSDPTRNGTVTIPGTSVEQDTPAGCQMTPGDPDCAGVFNHYGLGSRDADWVRVLALE